MAEQQKNDFTAPEQMRDYGTHFQINVLIFWGNNPLVLSRMPFLPPSQRGQWRLNADSQQVSGQPRALYLHSMTNQQHQSTEGKVLLAGLCSMHVDNAMSIKLGFKRNQAS